MSRRQSLRMRPLMRSENTKPAPSKSSQRLRDRLISLSVSVSPRCRSSTVMAPPASIRNAGSSVQGEPTCAGSTGRAASAMAARRLGTPWKLQISSAGMLATAMGRPTSASTSSARAVTTTSHSPGRACRRRLPSGCSTAGRSLLSASGVKASGRTGRSTSSRTVPETSKRISVSSRVGTSSTTRR